MVASAFNSDYPIDWWTPHLCGVVCGWSIHLHYILISMEVSPPPHIKYESTLVVVLLCIVGYHFTSSPYFLLAAFVLGFLGLLIPSLAQGIDFVWGKLLGYVGWVNSRVLLSLIFFVILMPLSFVYRLFNRDSLGLKKNSTSYFKVRNKTFEARDLEHPW